MEKNKDTEIKDKLEKEPLVHNFNPTQDLKSSFTPKVIALLGLVIVLGVVTGLVVSGSNSSTTNSSNSLGSILSGSSAPKGTVVGSSDSATFKDIAEGILKEGGVDGEGAFHLERTGGVSQNVYLTSSTVDLSKFINKKIKVWGQTQKAQTAGWLMDVGKIEVL